MLVLHQIRGSATAAITAKPQGTQITFNHACYSAVPCDSNPCLTRGAVLKHIPYVSRHIPALLQPARRQRGLQECRLLLLLLLPRHAAAVQLRHCCIAVANTAVEALPILACGYACGC
jgi:hypothetical protein